MIKIENMSFKWTDKPIFNNVSFNVNDGEKVGLVGINGSGKTTLFKILSGLEQADDGHIRVDNKVTFVPQEIKSDEIMDNSKNILDYVNPFNRPEYEIKRVLAGLGLKKINIEDRPQVLSGGLGSQFKRIKKLFVS